MSAPAWAWCECADPQCARRIALAGKAWDVIHAESRRFILSPHCPLSPGDTVIERHRGYVVIEAPAGNPNG